MTSSFTVNETPCGVVADDGALCRRTMHMHDPDSHDFSAGGAESVDGGRKWSDWIKMVHAVRGLLLPDSAEGEMTREGLVDEWPLDRCRGILTDVALAVELTVDRREDGSAIIKE